MSANKRTTKTINRRTRHVLKQQDSELSEAKQPKSNLDSFRVNRRVKKGGTKYEEKLISREEKVNQKVKN